MPVTFKNHNEWLRDNKVNSSRGAPMGCGDDAMLSDIKVHIDKLHWVDGDYDKSGMYWGRGNHRTHLYAIWQDEPDGERNCMYYRAKNRAEVVDYAISQGLTPLRGNSKRNKLP